MSIGMVSAERTEYEIGRAIATGFTVEYASGTTLLLDLDGAAAWADFPDRLGLLASSEVATIRNVEHYKSKSGNHHVIIEIAAPLNEAERIALQAALGSDGRRELLSLAGCLQGIPNSIVLFRPPGVSREPFIAAVAAQPAPDPTPADEVQF